MQKNYSPFGIGFKKPRVFAAGGGLVYYVRADYWKTQGWQNDKLKDCFATPFWAEYVPSTLKQQYYPNNTEVDYSHEREWRIPHDFSFEHNQVEFVIVNTYQDMASFPKNLKDEIGIEKFLLMENYNKIEQLWPVHIP